MARLLGSGEDGGNWNRVIFSGEAKGEGDDDGDGDEDDGAGLDVEVFSEEELLLELLVPLVGEGLGDVAVP